MALSIYKPGQGYWTRMLSAIGAGTIVVAGIAWLWEQLKVVPDYTKYWQGGMAIGMFLFWGGLLFWVLNRPRVVDFMIATEAEMKKVNWPNKREIIGSTWVVISGTFMFAVLIWVINLMFGALFQAIGILETAGGS